MHRIFGLLALLAAFVSTPTVADTGDSTPRLLVLGDSLSAGYGLDNAEQGWVSLMANAIDGQYQVVNASVSGDTTAGGLARLPKLLAEYRPALVIIELGGNDGLRGYSIAALRKNLTELTSSAQDAGARVLLMEMQIPPNYGRRYTEKFTALYAEVARDTGATLIPFFLAELALQDGMMQADGIHPTAQAQPAMRDAVMPFLTHASRPGSQPATASSVGP